MIINGYHDQNIKEDDDMTITDKQYYRQTNVNNTSIILTKIDAKLSVGLVADVQQLTVLMHVLSIRLDV